MYQPPDEVRDSDAGLGVRRLIRPWTRTSCSGGVTAAGALDDEDIAATKIARGKRNSSSVAFCSDRILTVDVCWRGGCTNRRTKLGAFHSSSSHFAGSLRLQKESRTQEFIAATAMHTEPIILLGGYRNAAEWTSMWHS